MCAASQAGRGARARYGRDRNVGRAAPRHDDAMGCNISEPRRHLGLLAAGAVLAATALPVEAQQARADAWWTGPMLAASGATLPQGHVLIEPYLYDAMITGHFDAEGQHHGASTEHDLG